MDAYEFQLVFNYFSRMIITNEAVAVYFGCNNYGIVRFQQVNHRR